MMFIMNGRASGGRNMLKNDRTIHDVLWLYELCCDDLTDIQKQQIEQLLYTFLQDLEILKSRS